MKIFIDEKEIAIKLEDEKTVGELEKNLTLFLNDKARIVVRVLLNQKLISKEDEATPLTDEIVLSLETKSQQELLIDSLAFLISNFDLLEKTLTSKKTSSPLQEKTDFQEIFTDLDLHLGENISNFFAKKLNIYLTDKTEKNENEILAIIPHLKLSLYERYQEFIDPIAEIKRTCEMLKELLPKIEEIPVNLQTGASKEALEKITLFTELIQKFNRILPLISIQLNLEELFGGEFTDILNELATAFENEDKILIGDLMEYEIAPRVEKIISFIDTL